MKKKNLLIVFACAFLIGGIAIIGHNQSASEEEPEMPVVEATEVPVEEVSTEAVTEASTETSTETVTEEVSEEGTEDEKVEEATSEETTSEETTEEDTEETTEKMKVSVVQGASYTCEYK